MAAMRGLLEIAVSEATKEHLLRTDRVCEWISDGETHLKLLHDYFHWYQTQSFQTANKGIATTLPPQATGHEARPSGTCCGKLTTTSLKYLKLGSIFQKEYYWTPSFVVSTITIWLLDSSSQRERKPQTTSRCIHSAILGCQNFLPLVTTEYRTHLLNELRVKLSWACCLFQLISGKG